MLPRNYRITAYNDSGASCDVTVTARRWYIDPSTGKPTYEASEATLLSATGVADGALATGTAQDNDADGFIGLDGLVVLSSGTGTGLVNVFIEDSTDGGTTWPTSQDGVPLGGGVPNDGDQFPVQA